MHTTMLPHLFQMVIVYQAFSEIESMGMSSINPKRSNQGRKAQCMLPSVAVQQLHVLCSQSGWSQTFSRRALKRTAALVCVSWPFFHILAVQMFVWLTTAGFRSVKMECLFPGLLIALCCRGRCVEHLSKELLPADWKATVWKTFNRVITGLILKCSFKLTKAKSRCSRFIYFLLFRHLRGTCLPLVYNLKKNTILLNRRIFKINRVLFYFLLEHVNLEK